MVEIEKRTVVRAESEVDSGLKKGKVTIYTYDMASRGTGKLLSLGKGRKPQATVTDR